MKNHYEVLTVTRNASTEVIQAAYRALAVKHHPDRLGPGASADKILQANRVLMELNLAKDVLLDADKRRAHDRELGSQPKPREPRRYQAAPAKPDREPAAPTRAAPKPAVPDRDSELRAQWQAFVHACMSMDFRTALKTPEVWAYLAEFGRVTECLSKRDQQQAARIAEDIAWGVKLSDCRREAAKRIFKVRELMPFDV